MSTTPRPPLLSDDDVRAISESESEFPDHWRDGFGYAETIYEAARAKDAEEIAKWKGIVKGVHGALTDIGTVPVPAMDADLYDAVMSIRAKDAERIEQLEALCRAMGNGLDEMMRPANRECDGAYCTGCWKDINGQLVKLLFAAGFKPSEP